MKMDMDMELVNVTPKIAKRYLENNGVNRTLSKKTIDAYARDMLNDKWKLKTGNAISISKDGVLLDGQHRLNAVIESDLAIPMWVCYGCDDDGVYDRNRGRSVRDQLNMSRRDLPAVMRSNSFLGMIRYVLVGNGKITSGDTEKYIDEHYDELSAFVNLGIFANTKAKITICTVYVALYWAFISGVPGDKIAEFMNVLRSGMTSCPEEYPIIAFRNHLLEDYNSKTVSEETIRLCQGALKKYITGSCLRRIYRPSTLLWSAKDRRAS